MVEFALCHGVAVVVAGHARPRANPPERGALCPPWPPFTIVDNERMVGGISLETQREAFIRMQQLMRVEYRRWSRCLQAMREARLTAAIARYRDVLLDPFAAEVISQQRGILLFRLEPIVDVERLYLDLAPNENALTLTHQQLLPQIVGDGLMDRIFPRHSLEPFRQLQQRYRALTAGRCQAIADGLALFAFFVIHYHTFSGLKTGSPIAHLRPTWRHGDGHGIRAACRSSRAATMLQG